uniref:Uncharacterized protein n=1 Tax=Oryza barthii TaxID=65489 RepID=A0A0D3HHL5_9ORYZ
MDLDAVQVLTMTEKWQHDARMMTAQTLEMVERKELVSRLEEEEKKRLIILSGICGGGSKIDEGDDRSVMGIGGYVAAFMEKKTSD